jgi:hypothetical protein
MVTWLKRKDLLPHCGITCMTEPLTVWPSGEVIDRARSINRITSGLSGGPTTRNAQYVSGCDRRALNFATIK